MKLAWQELIHQKKKYLLIETVIVLLVFMVLFLSGLANGLGRAVDSAVAESGADYFVISDRAEDLLTVSNLDLNAYDKIKSETGLEKDKLSSLDVSRMYIEKSGDDEKLDITYFAVEKGSFLEPKVFEGKGFMDNSGNSDSRADKEIILDDDYKVKGIRANDYITDSASGIKLKVVGFVKDMMYGHVSVGYISRETYEEIMANIDKIKGQVGTDVSANMVKMPIHSVAIKGNDTVSKLDLSGIVVDSKETIIDNLPGYKAEQTTINMITWVLVVVSAAIIGVFYYIITLQKEREFGVMKAIGVSMGKISKTICSQVFIVAGLGAIIANILAFAMAKALPQAMPFYLKIENAALVSIVFIAVSLITSLLSVAKVSKVDPVKAIGGTE